MTTPNDVRAIRARLGVTQHELAELLSANGRSITARTVGNWEAGRHPPPPFLRLALDRLVELHAPRGPGRPRKRRRS